jgi:hypothetical protein
MNFHLLDKKTKEKFLVLSALWSTFAGAFLIVAIANF